MPWHFMISRRTFQVFAAVIGGNLFAQNTVMTTFYVPALRTFNHAMSFICSLRSTGFYSDFLLTEM